MRRQRISSWKITHQPTRTTHVLLPIPSTRTLLLSSLIATPPRIEIAVTRSFKKRKHFLIETTLHVFPASLLLAPRAYSCSTAASTRIAETSKINRNISLIEPAVSHSKQKAAPQINRNISQGSRFTISIFTFPFSDFEREMPSVTPGFGVWSRPSGAPLPLCKDASNVPISKEPADAR